MLLMLHPKVAARSCDDCQKWMYLESGDQMKRFGEPVPRPKHCPTPCARCPKILPGAPPNPSSAVELTDSTLLTLQHYRECQAVGRFPDDPIVRRNAVIIRDIESEVEDAIAERRMQLIAQTVRDVVRLELRHGR